jgi:hypothetical protein
VHPAAPSGRPVTASTATAALRARRRHHVTHESSLFTPADGLSLDAGGLDAVSREAIDRQFVLEAQSSPRLPVGPIDFDELSRWQDAQFTALQQAVEEAFTEAVHDLVRPYVDPARRGSTGPLPVVNELGSVPPPTIARPGVRTLDLDVDLDDQPTRPIARTAPSRRELRSRRRDRERARVVLARRVATGGVLAMAAISTVAVAGPKMLQRLGAGGASADAELNLASSLAPRTAASATTPDPITAGAAKTSGLTTVSDASRGAGAAVVQLMQAQITAEAAEQVRLRAEAARQAAAQKAGRSSSRTPAAGSGGSTGSSSTGSSSSSGGSGKTPDSARAVAKGMIGSYGWSSSQFQCLNLLWNRESGWKYTAMNPSSGAYGIPQALPGSKMISAGSDWRTNPRTQIEWGLGYIKSRYGTPCAAWSHSQATNWY